MKKRLFALLLAISMIIMTVASLSSCDLLDFIDSLEQKESENTESTSDRETAGGDRPQEGDKKPSPEPPADSDDKPSAPHPIPDVDEFTSAQMNFAVNLFKGSVAQRENDSNQLISPISVMLALAMTANGAKGETLAEMEQTLGGLDIDRLTEALKIYVANLPEDEKYKLHIANSIWFRDDSDRLSVKDNFLSCGRDNFDAEIRKEPFDDGTLEDINAWVDENTDGMIKNVLDEIPGEAVMYLINALAFDAKWQTTFDDHSVSYGEFYAPDGSIKRVEMMSSEEYGYLVGADCRGFIKYYEDKSYAFVALLPDPDVDIYGYIASLDSASLYSMISDPISSPVNIKLPKFSYEYSLEMKPVLSGMGMTAAFDHSVADFSDMAVSSAGNIAISRVLHKTFIDVTQYGTRAGAATVIEATDEGISTPPPEVFLDRPFVYMIIECENNLPLFMGTVTDFEDAEVIGQVSSIEPTYSDSIRIDWYESFEYLEKFDDMIVNFYDRHPVIRIDSAEELKLLKERLGWQGGIIGDSIESEKTFLEKNSLFLVYVEEFSGSVELELVSCILGDTSEEDTLKLHIKERIPECVTDDMAGWLVAVGIPKAMSADITEYDVSISSELLVYEEEHDLSPATIRVDGLGFLQDRFANMIDTVSGGCPIMRIDSQEELDALTTLLSAEEGYFELDNKQGGESYRELCARLYEGYFDEYSLVIIYVTENSGSDALVLRESTYSQSNGVRSLNYTIARILPIDGTESTSDMAGWFVCATIGKRYAEDDINYNVEFVTDYYLTWE